MSRNLTTPFATALTTNAIRPFFMASIAFRSETVFVWTGLGPIAWDGMTFLGVGSMGKIGTVSEGVSVQAEGTSLTLSGIDLTLLNESLTDIQIGAPVTVWFGLMDSTNAVIADPCVMFKGTVDKPSIRIGPSTASITLNLENKLINLQRARQRRYTSADQRIKYPHDSGFSRVESLNDIALIWN